MSKAVVMSEEVAWIRAEQRAWRVVRAFDTSNAVVAIVTAPLPARR